MNFNEENTVEQLIIDSCESLGWKYVAGPELPRQQGDVFVDSQLRDALTRLNPEIAEQPDRADEVIYKLRAIQLSVATDGLVRSNEAFTQWMRNEKTMPFGENGQHTSIRLIDFENLDNNKFIVCNQWTYRVGDVERRFDVILLINGMPVVVGEAKTPVRPAITWVDGASQIHDNYEQSIPGMFVPNIFNFASDGRAYRYGSIRMPLTIWGPWRLGSQGSSDLATQLVRERGSYSVDKDSPLPVTDAAFESGTLADVQGELDDGPSAEALDRCIFRTAQWDRYDLLDAVIGAGGNFMNATSERRSCVLKYNVSAAYIEKAIALGASNSPASPRTLTTSPLDFVTRTVHRSVKHHNKKGPRRTNPRRPFDGTA